MRQAWLGSTRGRWLFLLFAVLAGCQRVQVGKRFLSDVLAGAALGSMVALALLKCGRLPGSMDRLEGFLRGDEAAAKEEGA